MIKYNENLYKLEQGNGFSNLNVKVQEFKENNPDVEVLSLGIGDVSMPIIGPIIDSMHIAVDELGDISTFKGYGNYYGIESLRKTILENDYKDLEFSLDEIYISNGTKSDMANILELFDKDINIYTTDPGYTVYRDGALLLGRNIDSIPISEENDFKPVIPNNRYDVIYLCSPNNPIGNTLNKEDLSKWVEYALINNSIILYDNVYSPFIRSEDVPLSIYEIEGARKCSIEFKSFSKTASFTGVRCSYYLIPNDIDENINKLWKKRTLNRTNGVDYIAQKGAEESYSNESKRLLKQNINIYLDNASILRECFESLNHKVWGGIDSPYLWIKINNEMNSWEFFEHFLNDLNIIIVPGSIFGENGEGYFRISSLGKKDDIISAVERIKKYYE